ncbi:unnamed protein product [Ilex paraguariensis]|uniref:ABC transporter domain-containing protein n=1 Tax=Ilex paraguariensis TaxID=185542 RepID=A0ABC8RTC9_9AQUA
MSMSQSTGRDHAESLHMELTADIGESFRSSFHLHASSFRSASDARSSRQNEDEVELQWAAIERLPTYKRLRLSLFDHTNLHGSNKEEGKAVIDVTKLGALERHVFIEKLLNKIEKDNHRLFQKVKERMDRVGLELPTVEVRYHNLTIEAECEVVQGKPLPTLWNTLKSFSCAITNVFGQNSHANKIEILQGVHGIIKPSRMTLLLGPPGCGKTTLLRALAGKLDQSLKVLGDISYNGYKLNEFVPQKTSAYISQHDLHISEMTVRETLDFSARCQGIGSRAGKIMMEISRREKQAEIIPDPDIDTYMKAISIEGSKRNLQTDYILKILGLDICADTIVGDAMRRGISGGQKRRLTTGEMIIGPAKVLLMDEISNGLDSSTTFQIVTCLQTWAHITESTIFVSLLQPSPEMYDLFDDIILMAKGKTVYHGPRDKVLEFFEDCGFRCPPRKGIADFLQEVVSEKDQAQYWYHEDQQPHSYVSVEEFGKMFKEFHVGQKLDEELSQPFSKTELHKNALSFTMYSHGKWELLKACMTREWLLMKRNSFVHIFKSAQLVVTALIAMTVFIRTHVSIDITHANLYMGSLFFALIRLMVNGIAELSLTVSRIAVFYKQRDVYFYPAWTYSIPAAILKIPFSFLDAFLFTALTYYVIGYSPEPERFFGQFLILFLLHQVSISLFRLTASVFQNPSVAASCGLFCLLVMFLFGGFTIPQPTLPVWLKWGCWLSPLTYAEIGASVNEFLAPSWQKVLSSNATIGQQVLAQRGLNYSSYFYWISIGALIGFWFAYNLGFTFALGYLKPPGRSRAIVSPKRLSDHSDSVEKNMGNIRQENEMPHIISSKPPVEAKKVGTVLPFEPMTVTFESVQYFVDTPKKMREQGFEQKKIQLLQDITGAFRPGVLTALMGVSGAGKTTLMDVLSGRKTGGVIEGDIRIGGYPKVQHTYARISGYCEQNDMHSPQITIEESVMYSAWLRLPSQIDRSTKSEFVAEVLQMIELDINKDALVGFPGVGGISTEQRKRLTTAVELVSNPSIIFMDEPTTGLDARAAAIVMRAVKNIVNTKRTVVCTIHQPNIGIFDAFDEVIH